MCAWEMGEIKIIPDDYTDIFSFFEKIYLIKNYVYICMFVCGYVHLNTGAHRDRKRMLDPLGQLWAPGVSVGVLCKSNVLP